MSGTPADFGGARTRGTDAWSAHPSRSRRRTAAVWCSVAVCGSGLLSAGVLWYRTPWREEAVVIGPLWTPEFAVAAQAVGLTALTVCLIRVVVALQRWRTHSALAFEAAALGTTGILVLWLLAMAISGFELIPADAHFTEMHSPGRDVVVRTEDDVDGRVERTAGVRDGLLVRWGATAFLHNVDVTG